MVADVAERERAEDRIAQCMDHDVAVRMRDETAIVLDVDATEHDVVAGSECVDVDALADAHTLGVVGKDVRLHRHPGEGREPASCAFGNTEKLGPGLRRDDASIRSIAATDTPPAQDPPPSSP